MKPPFTIGSLCTGYGGLEMGLALAGRELKLAFVADNDPAAAGLLGLRHPGVPNVGDIKTADWNTLPKVDGLLAGYPCQPFSLAGLKKGDKDERHLWPYVFDAVRVLRPGFVLLENVPGHRSRGFGRVLADLASIGYVGSWVSLRASDIGAAHQRDRVFIHAHPADATGIRRWNARTQSGQGIPTAAVTGHLGQLTLFPTPRASPNENRSTKRTPSQMAGRHGRYLASEVCELLPTPTAVDGNRALAHYPDQYTTLPDAVAQLLPTPRATDGTNGGPNQRGSKGDIALPAAVQPERWGRYAEAIARWERTLGRPAPDPTEPGRTTARRLAPRFVEWLLGLPDGWVCDVPDLTRNEQLRLLGNGVVPQQCAHALDLLSRAAIPPANTRLIGNQLMAALTTNLTLMEGR